MTDSLQGAPGPYFGDFGGRFVPEALQAALDELTDAYDKARIDPAFHRRALFISQFLNIASQLPPLLVLLKTPSDVPA